MSRKDELVSNLETVSTPGRAYWQARARLEITARPEPEEWAIRDVIVHCMHGTGISIARLEAALRDTQPHYPAWLGGADPFFAEEHVNDFNARIQEMHHGQSWAACTVNGERGFYAFSNWRERSQVPPCLTRSDTPGSGVTRCPPYY